MVGEDVAYGDLPRQKLDVYAPRRGPPGAPIVVFFYGGGWNHGRREDYDWAARAIAAQGFVVVVPDYRLYPEVRFPDFLADCAAAVRWAVDNGRGVGGDPGRIALAGHSAGAYNAAMLALDGRYLKAAGVDPASIRAFAGLAGPYDFLPLEEGVTEDSFGSAADPAITQPIAYASAGAPPAFLATGEDDTVVAPRNSQRLADVLNAKGAEAELHLYPGVGHVQIVLALSRPLRGAAPVLRDMTAFLRRHTT